MHKSQVYTKYTSTYTYCMNKTTEKHVITETLHVFKQARSACWNARFKIDTWYTKSTKEKDLGNAIVKAVQLQTEYNIMIGRNIPIYTTRKLNKHKFNFIADLAVTRIKNSNVNLRLLHSIKNHLKPFFGEYSIRDIDAKKLVEYEAWRNKKLGRVPAKDTVKEQNAALQRIFDEAVIQKCITQTELPDLVNNGRSGERRAAFTKFEYKRLVEESENWIEDVPQKKSQKIRRMLHYYIQVAALSGLRTGTEMGKLEW